MFDAGASCWRLCDCGIWRGGLTTAKPLTCYKTCSAIPNHSWMSERLRGQLSHLRTHFIICAYPREEQAGRAVMS